MRPLRDLSLRSVLLELTSTSGPEKVARATAARPPSPFTYRRLREELEAHGAPVDLVAAARRAEIEELERLGGVTARGDALPWKAPQHEVRHLVVVAVETAEGCVAASYEAALLLAAGDEDAELACRRADLAYRALLWAWPNLAVGEQRVVAAAVARAVDRLGRGAPLLDALARRLYAPLAAAMAA